MLYFKRKEMSLLSIINKRREVGPVCVGDIIDTTTLRTYYKFDGDTNADSGTNPNNASVVNGPVTYQAGRTSNTGQSIRLNSSSSQYLTMPSNTILPASGNFSISVWFKVDDYLKDPHFFSCGTGTGSGLRFLVRAGINDVLVTVGSTNVSFGLGFPPQQNEWVHLVYTYAKTSGNQQQIYWNGSLINTQSIGSATFTNNTTQYIGTRSNAAGSDGLINGVLDEYTAWEKVLTAQEVSDLYNSVCPLKA